MCRVFKKRIATVRKMNEHESPCWYDDQVSFMTELESPKQNSQSHMAYHHLPYSCKKEIDLQYQMPHEQYLQLPLLESPKLLQTTAASVSCNSMLAYGFDINHGSTIQSPSLNQDEQNLHPIYVYNNNEVAMDQVTDWRVLHKFVASQLSHEDVSKDNHRPSNAATVFHAAEYSNLLVQHLNKDEAMPENASTSTSSCQFELWK